jgi:hypothetical protein
LFSTELLAATYDNPASSENFDQLTCPCWLIIVSIVGCLACAYF